MVLLSGIQYSFGFQQATVRKSDGRGRGGELPAELLYGLKESVEWFYEWTPRLGFIGFGW